MGVRVLTVHALLKGRVCQRAIGRTQGPPFGLVEALRPPGFLPPWVLGPREGRARGKAYPPGDHRVGIARVRLLQIAFFASYQVRTLAKNHFTMRSPVATCGIQQGAQSLLVRLTARQFANNSHAGQAATQEHPQ
jgi:hypothetical protein